MNCPRKFLAAIGALVLAGATFAILHDQDNKDQGPAPSLKTGGAQAPSSPAPAGQTQDPRARIVGRVSLVIVPVTVKNSAGELVTDLQQSDFRVFEDSIEQPIEAFSAEAVPLSAAILIDDDLKTGTAEKVQKTLQTLAGGFSALDEVSLWRFDEVPEQISEEFIADNDKLLTQLKRIDLSSSIPGIGSYTMTNGPRVNTAQPPGPAKIPAEANGHPNTKHVTDAIWAAADQLKDRPRERRKIRSEERRVGKE
jgi:VWFA-related protein